MPSVGDVVRVRYEITGLLQQTAIFKHFSAQDRVLGRPISLRFFNAPLNSDVKFIEAITQNAKRTSMINNPGVERIEGLDDNGDEPFLIGQLSAGTCLTDRIMRLAPFSVSVAVGLGVSILDALSTLHASNIVHGDLQSDNIVVGPDGTAKLQLAGIWPAYSQSPVAGAMVLPSMSPYLAPEVSRGNNPSTSSDVYAVGVLIYWLLCGRMPYNADSAVAMALLHASGPIPSVKAYVPSVPVVLDEIIKKAMSRDPEGRYLNANQMLSDLRMLQDALRFGKTLSWPLSKVSSQARSSQATVKQTKPSVSQDSKSRFANGVGFKANQRQGNEQASYSAAQSVAPKMGALSPSDKPKKSKNNERDVPTWLLAVISALIGVAVMGAISIWLWLNLTRPKMIQVPNLVGKDVAQARNLLESMGVQMRQINTRPDPNVPAQSIIQSDPSSGERLREGGIVNVVVSTGSTQIQAPDLRGLTLDQATTMLKSDNLRLSPNSSKVSSNSVPIGQIVAQNPKAGQQIGIYSMISVSISSGPPLQPTAPTNPDGTNPDSNSTQNANAGDQTSNSSSTDANNQKTIYHLTITLNDIKNEVILRVDMQDSRGTNTILSEVHDPGDKVPITAVGYGSSATFKIYYDDSLVKTVTKQASSKPAAHGTNTNSNPPSNDGNNDNGVNE